MRKVFVLISVFLLILFFGCADEPLSINDEFEINNENFTTQIKLWTAEDGSHHLFLPSYYDGKDPVQKNITVHRSSSVATLYINTQSGNMDSIYADKEYREPAEAILITADGVIDYQTNACSLKGRGNSTWDFFEKKPFQLKLEESANLLQMGEGKKWILLANAFDETSLRNKLIYDLAKKNGLCASPECEYVDLYLNGEYHGLYLLTERVEFGEGRLQANDPNAFLCNIEYLDRWETLSNAFVTEYNRAVEIREPDKPSESKVEQISQLVQAMENVILYSPDESISEVLDIDSWVYKYLIDEMMENGDSDIASSYFYYENGKFIGGPLWDYDNTLGVSTRNQNPSAFLARSRYHSINNETPYYDSLYSNPYFYNKMTELYQTKFLPAIEDMINNDICRLESSIEDATESNKIRWKSMFDAQNANIIDGDGIADYLKKRIEFLNSVWIEDEVYCSVQFEPYVIDMYATNKTYPTSYAIKYGECFTDLTIPKITDINGTTWINSKTGEIFNPDQPITEDITLLLKR